MAKYDPLIQRLVSEAGDELTLTFADVEQILGATLPPAARDYPAWWANSADDPTHSWARGWVAAGWLARVDLDTQRVVFRKADVPVVTAPPTRLEDLRPRAVEPVMDLVERAGVDVSEWAFNASGAPVASPRSNPNYCSDWSFGSTTEGFVLCLWFDDLVEEPGYRIVSRSDVHRHRLELEQERRKPGIDVSRRNAISQQARHARDFEFALEESHRLNHPVRVIINAGVRPTRVDYRELDDAPWFVHRRDGAGKWLIVRAVPPGTDEEGGPVPADDDNSPGADDYRRWASIKVRRGQPKFRADLIGAYGGRCAVTATRIEELLEAAHIVPHAEGTNYRVSNGLLLRADIHTLFDLHLLSVDDRFRVHLSKRLKFSDYRTYDGATLKTLPSTTAQQPSTGGLRMRHARFLAAEANRDDV